MRKKTASFYETLAKAAKVSGLKACDFSPMDFSKKIRYLRKQKGLAGVELCRLAGDLDPKTLTAFEKGRIRNPSIQTLQSLSRGLGLPVSELFRQTEMAVDHHFYAGSQKGAYFLEFPRLGAKIVSFTPLIKPFFCGKLILSGKRKLEGHFLNHPSPLFVTVLVGRFEIEVEDRKTLLREGDNLYFNGSFRHTYHNLLQRDSVLLMVTAPSFI